MAISTEVGAGVVALAIHGFLASCAANGGIRVINGALGCQALTGHPVLTEAEANVSSAAQKRGLVKLLCRRCDGVQDAQSERGGE